eukprot:gene3728-4669_t
MVDTAFDAPTYASRLLKYSYRGFAVAVPGFREDLVDPRSCITERNIGNYLGRRANHPWLRHPAAYCERVGRTVDNFETIPSRRSAPIGDRFDAGTTVAQGVDDQRRGWHCI